MAYRNNYIDLLRGIAALSVIAIHTAFWSGESYTPMWFRNLTLFIDVPLFFYLSGWASGYGKSDIIKTGKGIINIWLKWIFFISLLALVCLITKLLPIQFQGVTDVRDLLNNYMFNVSFPGFKVVAGSIWFMPYYFIVVFINTIVISFINKCTRVSELKFMYMYILLGLFAWIIYGRDIFGLDIFFIFYSLFWMLGYNRVGTSEPVRFVTLLALCVGGFFLASYLQGIPFYDLQSAKFPPTLKYGAASMITILVVKFFENKVKKCNAFLVHIGRNAIYYYFAQGVSSSFIYLFIPRININLWFAKWIILFVLNVLMAVIMAEAMAAVYKGLSRNNPIKYIIKKVVRERNEKTAC